MQGPIQHDKNLESKVREWLITELQFLPHSHQSEKDSTVSDIVEAARENPANNSIYSVPLAPSIDDIALVCTPDTIDFWTYLCTYIRSPLFVKLVRDNIRINQASIINFNDMLSKKPAIFIEKQKRQHEAWTRREEARNSRKAKLDRIEQLKRKLNALRDNISHSETKRDETQLSIRIAQDVRESVAILIHSSYRRQSDLLKKMRTSLETLLQGVFVQGTGNMDISTTQNSVIEHNAPDGEIVKIFHKKKPTSNGSQGCADQYNAISELENIAKHTEKDISRKLKVLDLDKFREKVLHELRMKLSKGFLTLEKLKLENQKYRKCFEEICRRQSCNKEHLDASVISSAHTAAENAVDLYIDEQQSYLENRLKHEQDAFVQLQNAWSNILVHEKELLKFEQEISTACEQQEQHITRIMQYINVYNLLRDNEIQEQAGALQSQLTLVKEKIVDDTRFIQTRFNVDQCEFIANDRLVPMRDIEIMRMENTTDNTKSQSLSATDLLRVAADLQFLFSKDKLGEKISRQKRRTERLHKECEKLLKYKYLGKMNRNDHIAELRESSRILQVGLNTIQSATESLREWRDLPIREAAPWLKYDSKNLQFWEKASIM